MVRLLSTLAVAILAVSSVIYAVAASESPPLVYLCGADPNG